MADTQSFIKDVQCKQDIMSLINDTQVQIQKQSELNYQKTLDMSHQLGKSWNSREEKVHLEIVLTNTRE